MLTENMKISRIIIFRYLAVILVILFIAVTTYRTWRNTSKEHFTPSPKPLAQSSLPVIPNDSGSYTLKFENGDTIAGEYSPQTGQFSGVVETLNGKGVNQGAKIRGMVNEDGVLTIRGDLNGEVQYYQIGAENLLIQVRERDYPMEETAMEVENIVPLAYSDEMGMGVGSGSIQEDFSSVCRAELLNLLDEEAGKEAVQMKPTGANRCGDEDLVREKTKQSLSKDVMNQDTRHLNPFNKSQDLPEKQNPFKDHDVQTAMLKERPSSIDSFTKLDVPSKTSSSTKSSSSNHSKTVMEKLMKHYNFADDDHTVDMLEWTSIKPGAKDGYVILRVKISKKDIAPAYANFVLYDDQSQNRFNPVFGYFSSKESMPSMTTAQNDKMITILKSLSKILLNEKNDVKVENMDMKHDKNGFVVVEFDVNKKRLIGMLNAQDATEASSVVLPMDMDAELIKVLDDGFIAVENVKGVDDSKEGFLNYGYVQPGTYNETTNACADFGNDASPNWSSPCNRVVSALPMLDAQSMSMPMGYTHTPIGTDIGYAFAQQ